MVHKHRTQKEVSCIREPMVYYKSLGYSILKDKERLPTYVLSKHLSLGGRFLLGEDMKKTCSKCGEEKALSEFYKHKTNKDGYSGMCKKCCLAYKKLY